MLFRSSIRNLTEDTFNSTTLKTRLFLTENGIDNDNHDLQKHLIYNGLINLKNNEYNFKLNYAAFLNNIRKCRERNITTPQPNPLGEYPYPNNYIVISKTSTGEITLKAHDLLICKIDDKTYHYMISQREGDSRPETVYIYHINFENVEIGRAHV